VPGKARVLHHCNNTGSLAMVHYGTALGVIYAAHGKKKVSMVWVDETRSRLQGARLTAWELMKVKIPMRLIADSAAGFLTSRGKGKEHTHILCWYCVSAHTHILTYSLLGFFSLVV
jgi:methylthioribose-1-phosphate isomerase